MDRLGKTCIVHLYHCYANSHPLSDVVKPAHNESPSGCYVRRHIKV